MRFACLIITATLALSFATTTQADNPKDQPKDSKSSEQTGNSGARKLIVGRWSPVKEKEKATIEFFDGGKLKISGEGMIMIDGGYKFLDDSTIEVKMSFGGEEKTTKLKVTVTKDELTTQEIAADGKEKEKESFKRLP